MVQGSDGPGVVLKVSGGAAFASLAIGALYLFGASALLFYVAAGVLGFATGSVETFEPTMISKVVASHRLSEGMGWLSATRAAGLLVANLALGFLFYYFPDFEKYLFLSVLGTFALVFGLFSIILGFYRTEPAARAA